MTAPKPNPRKRFVLRGRPLAERFRAQVGPPISSGCRLWLGRSDADGYGRIESFGREVLAHRFALEQKLGRDLQPGECAAHSCDVPLCIEPSHLFVASVAENNADMVAKGRASHPAIKLTDAQAEEIRQRRAAGESAQKLAAEYGVSDRLVYYVERGEKRRAPSVPVPVPRGYFVKTMKGGPGFIATARGEGFEFIDEAVKRADAIRRVLARVEAHLTGNVGAA